MMSIYTLHEPLGVRVPILLSIPHSGFEIPENLKSIYNASLLPPDDTDWFVSDLYSFAHEMGITVLSASLSRWVIDLNRDPKGESLYNDNRVITGLCPVTDFNGKQIYNDIRHHPGKNEIENRKNIYFYPYHNKIQEILDDLNQEFGHVLLWDCHSIRRHVPGIQKDPFPDMILGTNDGKSVLPKLTEIVTKSLSYDKYQLSINDPFRGGYITRSFGVPDRNQYARQLEMSKDLYMDKNGKKYDQVKAKDVQALLKRTLSELIIYMQNLENGKQQII